MKKQGIIILLSIVLSFAFTAESFSEEEAGRVLAVKKNVYVIRNDNRGEAVPKMPLLMSDAVETDAKSRTKLFFTDDSILSLGENSRVEVQEYIYNSEENKSKSIYKLMDGYLKVVVGRSDLEIHTPTAVAAARGTKFIVVTGGKGASAYTDVIVLSGRVDTWSSMRGMAAGKVSVGAGKSNRTQGNKPPGTSQTTKAEVLNQFADSTVVVEDMRSDPTVLPTMVTPEVDPPRPPPPPPPPLPPPPVEAFTPVTITINFD